MIQMARTSVEVGEARWTCSAVHEPFGSGRLFVLRIEVAGQRPSGAKPFRAPIAVVLKLAILFQRATFPRKTGGSDFGALPDTH